MVKRLASFVLALLLIGLSVAVFPVKLVRAYHIIRILSNGAIDPPSVPIMCVNNTYYFTDNIADSAVYVEKSSIVVDGSGYGLYGGGLVDVGFVLGGVNSVIIRNTIISGFTSYGVCLNITQNNVVLENNITNSQYGIMVDASYFTEIIGNRIEYNDEGVFIRYSNHNSVHNDFLRYNSIAGISLLDSWANDIDQNIIENDRDAIRFEGDGCAANNVRGNSISHGHCGITMLALPSNNSFYHNSFVNNSLQVSFEGLSWNRWDNGYPAGGNYWWWYYGGNDTDGDGIGDTPYSLDELNIDNYPLMGTFGPSTPPGANVVVFPADDVCLTYETVTLGGLTTVEKPTTGPAPPPGFSISQYYIIETTADYAGDISIKIIYDMLIGARGDSTMQESWRLLQCVMLTGDVDKDFDVDIFDLVRLAGRYGVIKPNPKYDHQCDLDHDGDIDIFDLVAMAGNYGKTWNPTTGWSDITTRVDVANNSIFGVTIHLSIFGVTQHG